MLLCVCTAYKIAFSQQVYYVDVNNGNDAHNGTIQNPWKNAQISINKMVAGDTLIFRAGTYATTAKITVGTNNITLKSYEGEMAIFHSQDFATIFIADDVSGTRLERLEIQAPQLNGIQLGIGVADVTISQCKIHNVNNEGIKIPSGQSGEGKRIKNVLIEYCEIYNTNTANDNNGDGVDVVNGENITIRNCHFHDITNSHAFYFKGGSQGCIAENNYIENVQAGIALGFSTDCEFFDTTMNPGFYGCIDCTVKNNVIVNTQSYGIGLFGSLRAQVYNNTLVDVAHTQRGGIHFEFNTPNGCTQNAKPVTDAKVINNIVVLTQASVRTVIEVRNNDSSSGLTGDNTVIDHNIYFKNSAAVEFRFNGGRFNFNLWKDFSKGDAHSLLSDPGLTLTYHLAEGSPCIGVGQTVPSVLKDIDGNARSGAYDIGADQFNNEGCVITLPPIQIGVGLDCKSEDVISGVEAPLDVEILVFPNPAKDVINLFNASNDVLDYIVIYDRNGRAVHHHSMSIENTAALDISLLANGYYTLRIVGHRSSYSARFIKLSY